MMPPDYSKGEFTAEYLSGMDDDQFLRFARPSP